MSCNICCDDYNKSTRSKICCGYCGFDMCRSCCETYILNETIPKCMNPDCAKEWSRKFLRENFTNVFLTSKYKEHLEKVLFDQEKALMPGTQPLVEERLRVSDLRKQMSAIDKLISDLVRQKRDLEHKIFYGKDDKKDEKARFVRQCPANGCRGFLSTQWKCGICDQWSCPECHELKGPNRDCEHTCDPNNIETAKMLAKDSKPCPKCQSMIFKISGCDQMWCTQCHTAFSWKTGQLENLIHNPHFYEWQRKNGNATRNLGDIECGREIDHNTCARVMTLSKKHADLYIKTDKWLKSDGKTYFDPILQICNVIRNAIHINRVEIPKFRTDYVTRNQWLRVGYLENRITENSFKQQIQRNDKKNRKNTEILQVLRLAVTTITDIIFRLIDNLEKSDDGKHDMALFLREIDEIRKYCNDIFMDISFTYTTVKYEFNPTLQIISISKKKKESSISKKKKESQKLAAAGKIDDYDDYDDDDYYYATDDEPLI